MALSQRDYSLQMIAQLRLLDPSVSAEVGTPERKIIDTVAQGIFDSQIDLDALSQALDIDSKYGAQLDRFFNLFGFARQRATGSTGFATFSRLTPSTTDIRIPASTVVVAPALADSFGDVADVNFTTLYDVILPAGLTSVVAPIRAVVAGASGNVASGRISDFGPTPIYGVTSVTNEAPTSGGNNSEDDNEFKVRFKNTVFRNLAGTQDQYMALAVATAFSTKANVIGPQSHYREYIQIPPVDDATAYDVGGTTATEAGNGAANQYTSALSTIPFAKYIYSSELPVFVSSRDIGPEMVFYRQDVDFTVNAQPNTNKGDAYRLATVGLDIDPTGTTAKYRPNVTFTNVYTGVNADVTAIRPNDLVLFEFSYMSEASRNDFSKGITNSVDVYVDGGNETVASTVITRPTTGSALIDNTASKFHYENYRRVGEPTKRPITGNVLTPLFWEPVLDLPDQIEVEGVQYFKNIHYWAVEDVSSLAGTIRARNGIEWSTTVRGREDTNVEESPDLYTGKIITDATGDPIGGAPIEIIDYIYDKNIVDLQASLEGAKQVTTDVLAHKAQERFFKLDITTMYSNGGSIAEADGIVGSSVDRFLRSQNFGSVIQLSDLLQVVHDVPNIDNVRWSSDMPNSPDLIRVVECDINGRPLVGVTVDVIQEGHGALTNKAAAAVAARAEIQAIYLTGAPTSGTFKLRYNTATSADISVASGTLVADITAALTAIGAPASTVTEDARGTAGVKYPIRSFRVTFTATGVVLPLQVVPGSTVLGGGPFNIMSDFFLRDNELARLPENTYTPLTGVPDTVPGLIIRPRAQNTFLRRQ